jgi:DNA-binding SARP family transcriptional activator
MLTIRLLGQPEISRNEQPLRLPRRKSRALTYYLAASPQPVRREQLLDLFWIDLPRQSARQVLRTTLSEMRKTLGDALLSEDENVAIRAEAWVDAREFSAALSAREPGGDLSMTLDLYRGEFLAGFSLNDAPEYETWLLTERERYHRLLVRGLTLLSRRREAAGDFAGALAALDRALAPNLLQEDLQREAIRLAYLAGDRPDAIRRYDQFRRLLDEEMGIPPMAETRSLYDAIITDRLAATPASRLPAVPPPDRRVTPGSIPFAGRAAELQALEEITAGQRLALLEGEPGIGKTRLAREFLRLAPGLALSGQARELEQHIPYQPFIDALRSLPQQPDWPALRGELRNGLPPVWQGEVARLLPELDGSSAGDPRLSESRLWEGVYRFLAALARRQPVTLFLDDLHWADASTLAMLGYLVRQPGHPTGRHPLRFIAAARPAAPRSPLAMLAQALAREDRLRRIPLARLSGADIQRIAGEISPSDRARLADWLEQTSEGNPFILTELVRHGREAGLLQPDGSFSPVATAGAPLLPHSVYTLIASRLNRLSEPARRVLDAAVAVGREFDFRLVERATALSENAALDGLDELLAAGLVTPLAGERYAFDHSLTMEVAYREVGEPRHRRLHGRVAEALESLSRGHLPEVAGLLAFHFSENGEDERAAPYALIAGQQAQRLPAYPEAAGFFQLALRGLHGNARLSALLALAQTGVNAGSFSATVDAGQEAAALAQSLGDAGARDQARLLYGRAMLSLARYAEAAESARQVLEDGLPESAVAAELLWGTALSLEGADLDAAASHLRSARAACAGSSPRDPVLLAQILFELGGVLAQQGNLREAVSLYRQSLEQASGHSGDMADTLQVLAGNNLAYHRLLLADPGAEADALAAMKLAEERGVVGMQPYLYSTLGEIAMTRGDLDSAQERFESGLALARRLPSPERVAGLTANLGRLAQMRGDMAEARRLLAEAMDEADRLGVGHLSAQTRLWLAPLLPRDEARARLEQAKQIAEQGSRRLLVEEAERLLREDAGGRDIHE